VGMNLMQGICHVLNTGSHPITKVKQRRAYMVSTWIGDRAIKACNLFKQLSRAVYKMALTS
jgi:hypothetical protein